MKSMDRERRDWSLLIFIVPIGIFLMIIAGQIAIRIMPHWSVNAGMQSRLDPNSASSQPISLFQPILPQILTPMAWAESYLTPGQDISFPPFFVFVPSATPSPTAVSPTPTEPSPTDTATVTVSPIPTTPYVPPPTSTTNPPDDDPDPITVTATATATDTSTGYPSTLDPSWNLVSPAPSEIDPDAPDGTPAAIQNGTYVVLDVRGNPVIVQGTPDGNYDLVFYEYLNGNAVYLDHIIIGISKLSDGSLYYEVFNWGNGIPDENTNVDTAVLPPDPDPLCVEPECENREIPKGNLHNDSGILIDVDNAPSAPPADSYDYIVIISPLKPSGDPSHVDAIVVTEVPISPTP